MASAAFGFELTTFAPTYQLIYGSPGRSLALEIAGRLGLNPSVVAAARENLSAREAQLAEHLAKIDHDMRALEHEHRLAARERETLKEAEARMQQREDALRQREETFKRRLNEELERAGARRRARKSTRSSPTLKAKADAIAQRRRAWCSTGEPARRAATRARAVDAIAARANAGEAPSSHRAEPPAISHQPPSLSAAASSSAASASKRS